MVNAMKYRITLKFYAYISTRNNTSCGESSASAEVYVSDDVRLRDRLE